MSDEGPVEERVSGVADRFLGDEASQPGAISFGLAPTMFDSRPNMGRRAVRDEDRTSYNRRKIS